MNRRCKVLQVSPELVFNLMQQRWQNKPGIGYLQIVDNSLPADVVFERADFCFLSNMFRFLVSHPSFEEISEGEMFPPIYPVFQITT